MNIEDKNKTNRHLHLYVTRIVTLGAILCAIIASTVFVFHTRSDQRNILEKSISQLFVTVENTAQIAAYLHNEELAREVVDSLSKNDIVSTIVFTSHSGLKISSNDQLTDFKNALSFRVSNPFELSEEIGEIKIQPNKNLLDQYVMRSAVDQILIQLVLIVVIASLVLNMMIRVLTTPIQSIAANLHVIKPGDAGQLTCPVGHENNDIGNLVVDINKLLDSARKTIEQERLLRNRVEHMEKHFRLIFERASAGIFLLNTDFYLTSSNQAFKNIAGIVEKERREDKKHVYLPDLFQDSQVVCKLLHETLNTKRQFARDLRLAYVVNDEERWLHCLFSTVQTDTKEILIEGLVIDVTERTFQMERILFESEHDPLTRLFNRRAGEHLLDIMLTDAHENNSFIMLLIIDLDGFKKVNDTFGHEAGDIVLVEVASRMQVAIRKEDVLIRLGGDEFLVAFALKSNDCQETDFYVDKLQSCFKKEIQLYDNQTADIGSSIGIAIYPRDGDDIDSLIANADTAMYQSKRNGKNCATYYLAA